MARPPWGILLCLILDALAAIPCIATGLFGLYALVVGLVTMAVGADSWIPPSYFAKIGFWLALGGLSLGGALVYTMWNLWRGTPWARWPSVAVAVLAMPAAGMLTAWVEQGSLLVLVVVGPVAIIGLFLPDARRYVGTAPAEPVTN